MKIYNDEKLQGLQRMILLVEIIANVKRFGFRVYKLKDEELLKHSVSVGCILFQICLM